MKKSKKKGFTIVELVIVIAVIAILAAVLIPTFSGVVNKANASKAMQAAKHEWTEYCAENTSTFSEFDGFIEVDGKYYFTITDGQFNPTESTTKPSGTAVTGYTEKTTGVEIYTAAADPTPES